MKHYYDETGRLLTSCEYLNGMKNGKCIDYYSDNVIKGISHYKNDTLDGVVETYFSNGILSTRTSYVNGKKNGKFNIFFRNGNIAQSGSYVEDMRKGIVYEYDMIDSGRVVTEAKILNAEDSEFLYYLKAYDVSGKVVSNLKNFELINKNDDKTFYEILYTGNNEYDSMQLIIANFSSDFEITDSYVDTLGFKGNRIILGSDRPLGSIFRAKFLGFKTYLEQDTIVSSIRVEYIEESFPN